MIFRDYLKKFSSQDNPLGDLVNDILRDKEFNDSWDIEKIQQYLSWKLGHDDRDKLVNKLINGYKKINQN